MNKEIYEQYAEYYLNQFKDLKGLTITKKWRTEEILHIDISTKLPYFEFFMGLYPNMITFDGICVCDHGIEFDNIETIDSNKIFSLLDEESKLIKLYIREGLFLFAYKNNEEVMASSMDILNRKKAMKNLDIESCYNKYRTSGYPPFEEIDRIELKDFYNNIIYEYNAKTIEKK